MEIKKADSEGRVSGFDPGEYYWFVKLSPLESALAEDLEWMDGKEEALNHPPGRGYTGGSDKPHGPVHEARWWDTDNQRWVYPNDN